MSFSELCVQHRGPSCLADPALLPHTAAPILLELRATGATARLSDDDKKCKRVDIVPCLRGLLRCTLNARGTLPLDPRGINPVDMEDAETDIELGDKKCKRVDKGYSQVRVTRLYIERGVVRNERGYSTLTYLGYVCVGNANMPFETALKISAETCHFFKQARFHIKLPLCSPFGYPLVRNHPTERSQYQTFIQPR
jgi:hypothetical protein